MTVLLDGATGAQALADSLGQHVTAAGLFEAITPFMPFVGALVIFGFGYRVLKRSVGGASKGKAKI